MAMQELKKKEVITEKPTAQEIEKKVLTAVDEVASDETAFLKEEENGDLTILGDPNQTDEPANDTVYNVTFLFDKSTHKISDFEGIEVSDINKDFFSISTTATQEPITPNNRTYLATVGTQFLTMFFVEHGDGNYELKTEKELNDTTLEFYRDEKLIENLKYFVGKLLGLDEELIPYQNDIQLLENGLDLISKNPTLINEAYYKVK